MKIKKNVDNNEHIVPIYSKTINFKINAIVRLRMMYWKREENSVKHRDGKNVYLKPFKIATCIPMIVVSC